MFEKGLLVFLATLAVAFSKGVFSSADPVRENAGEDGICRGG